MYLNKYTNKFITEPHMEEKNDNIDVSKIDDFDQLLELVRMDANLVDGLTDEQVTELRKKLNPYGRTIEGSGTYTCLSITNMSEQYMKRFLMTSLIGFLYRQCDEHELDDGEPPCPMDDFTAFMIEYSKAVSAAEISKEWLSVFWKIFRDDNWSEESLTPEQKAERLTHQRVVEKGGGFKKRLVVRQFLDGLFQYNPDKHVRSAYSNNPLDPERVTPEQVKTTKKEIKTIIGKSGAKITIDKPAVEDSSIPNDVDVTPMEYMKRSTSEFVKHIPPSDVFHRWSYYTDSNYEEVRSAVTDLYADKPDLEFAVNPYDQFASKEDAEKFVQKHKNEVIADVLTLTNSKWNLCGSFKTNRDRVNFYNEKTAVIEEIFKQLEQDKKLGADLMRKRVRRKKQKNIEESGPEPEEFKQYKKDHPSSFENMGAEDVTRQDDKSKDSDCVTFKIHEDCPYDAIQVDVFDIKKGGQIVNKSEFFTQAETPEPITAITETEKNIK